MTEMIERVAKALQLDDMGNLPDEAHITWGEDDPDDAYQNRYRHIARVAIEAMREPTQEMLTAGYGYYSNLRTTLGRENATLFYNATIDAALGQS